MREEELQNLVRKIQRRQTEFQTVELKAAAKDFPRKIYDTLSSFSNQDEGGVIIFGLSERDNYEAVGVYDVQSAQKKAMEACEQMEPNVRPVFTVTEIDGVSPVAVSLDVKDFGKMDVSIGGALFAGSLGGGYHVQSAAVGGAWNGGTAKATVEIAEDDLDLFPGTLLTSLLPNEETASAKNSKWTFNKAASVKWAKPKKGAEHSEFYDEVADKDLIIDDTKGKTNVSGLKLTYTAKTGVFKGSFKVYALEGEGKKTKLKKYTVNVSGFVLDGVGYGTATCKKPAISWSVTVR